jgi:phosphoglycolate phosphatase
MYVATSKPGVFAEKILAHFELEQFFSGMFGSELDGRRSNKIELLEHALAVNASKNAVMVGDREHDVIGAIRNSMRIIAVSYGYGTEEELRGAGADQIAGSPRELGVLLSGR